MIYKIVKSIWFHGDIVSYIQNIYLVKLCHKFTLFMSHDGNLLTMIVVSRKLLSLGEDGSQQNLISKYVFFYTQILFTELRKWNDVFVTICGNSIQMLNCLKLSCFNFWEHIVTVKRTINRLTVKMNEKSLRFHCIFTSFIGKILLSRCLSYLSRLFSYKFKRIVPSEVYSLNCRFSFIFIWVECKEGKKEKFT